jgi:hypothetical protein
VRVRPDGTFSTQHPLTGNSPWTVCNTANCPFSTDPICFICLTNLCLRTPGVIQCPQRCQRAVIPHDAIRNIPIQPDDEIHPHDPNSNFRVQRVNDTITLTRVVDGRQRQPGHPNIELLRRNPAPVFAHANRGALPGNPNHENDIPPDLPPPNNPPPANNPPNPAPPAREFAVPIINTTINIPPPPAHPAPQQPAPRQLEPFDPNRTARVPIYFLNKPETTTKWYYYIAPIIFTACAFTYFRVNHALPMILGGVSIALASEWFFPARIGDNWFFGGQPITDITLHTSNEVRMSYGAQFNSFSLEEISVDGLEYLMGEIPGLSPHDTAIEVCLARLQNYNRHFRTHNLLAENTATHYFQYCLAMKRRRRAAGQGSYVPQI